MGIIFIANCNGMWVSIRKSVFPSNSVEIDSIIAHSNQSEEDSTLATSTTGWELIPFIVF